MCPISTKTLCFKSCQLFEWQSTEVRLIKLSGHYNAKLHGQLAALPCTITQLWSSTNANFILHNYIVHYEPSQNDMKECLGRQMMGHCHEKKENVAFNKFFNGLTVYDVICGKHFFCKSQRTICIFKSVKYMKNMLSFPWMFASAGDLDYNSFR